MSINKYQPHILVIPEDDAYRQIYNGFVRSNLPQNRQMQCLDVSGGWLKVIEKINDQKIKMRRFTARYLLLLVDLDDNPDRAQEIRDKVPSELADRVFLLSVLSEAERLKSSFGQFEEIGGRVANSCDDQADNFWQNPILNHNLEELKTLKMVFKTLS